MRLKKLVSVFLVFTGLLLADCSPQTTTPLPTETPQALPPIAALNAVRALSASVEVPVEEIAIISYERHEWPDACLGLAREDEMCAQVITPGWRVVLSAGGEQYVYRTDDTGEIVQPENPDNLPGGGEPIIL